MIKTVKKTFFIVLLLIVNLVSLSNALEINLSFQKAEGQPYFIGQPEMNIDAEEFNTVILKIKSSRSGTAKLFWASSYDPQFNEPKSIWFFLDKSKDFKEYVFNIKSQNPNWLGFVPQLLLFPEGGTDGVEIQSGKALVGNLMTNLRSGWREFWGPRGRVIIGSTINTMQSPNLFGRSIYVYIYWIIGLITLGCFGFEVYQWSGMKKRQPFEIVISHTGKAVFLIIIVFWGLLELSSFFNNWIAFKDDLKYFGKSYQDKLVLANTGDFYPFIEFCEKNLPLRAKLDLRVPPFYNDIKARYYLYPRQVSTAEAEYLIVYDREVEKEVAEKYSLWKTFRPNAYILKKKK
jgi:hypothetical protein